MTSMEAPTIARATCVYELGQARHGLARHVEFMRAQTTINEGMRRYAHDYRFTISMYEDQIARHVYHAVR
jgi:hypothetical protein